MRPAAPRARRQKPAVGRTIHRIDAVPVMQHRKTLPILNQIPYLDGAMGPAADQPSAVGSESHERRGATDNRGKAGRSRLSVGRE